MSDDTDELIHAVDQFQYLEKYGVDLDFYPSPDARYRLSIKLETFEAYGGCRCDWCDVSDPVVLTIDHIYQDGAAQHRAGQPRGGTALCLWLKRHGYPPGYRVLCFNHNIMAAWLAQRGIYQDRYGNPIDMIKPATNGHLVEEV
jgi:hypothetical protein